jgi:O-acetyl-ADP-ribose deacetylase
MATYIFNNLTVLIEQGDITRQNVDAIVNAANSHLIHGGGVAVAIANQGGSSIQRESDEWVKIHGLVTHDHPAITGAGSLPCQYVIHAVGPVWGEKDEIEKLIRTIRACLIVANDLKCGSVAFPAISTGIFRFPLELAARCFLSRVSEFASENILFFLHTVKIILFDETACRIFLNVFSQKENQ